MRMGFYLQLYAVFVQLHYRSISFHSTLGKTKNLESSVLNRAFSLTKRKHPGTWGRASYPLYGRRSQSECRPRSHRENNHALLIQAMSELALPHSIVVFANGQTALGYLKTTTQISFFIRSEVSMPAMNGLELRQQID